MYYSLQLQIIIVKMQICYVITRISEFVTWHNQRFNCCSGCPSLCGLSGLPVPLTHLYSNTHLSVFFNVLVCRLLSIFEESFCLSRGKLSLLEKSLLCLVIFCKTQRQSLKSEIDQLVLNFPDVQIGVLYVSSCKAVSKFDMCPRSFAYFYDYLRLVKKAMLYKLLYFLKVSLLLVFSVGDGEMGTVPCATKTVLCP